MKRAGFTFIELVLVTIVLSILLVAVMPRFQHTMQAQRLEHRAFEFVQLLRYAHEQAIAENQETIWVWDPNTRRAHVELSQSDDTQGPHDEQDVTASRVAQSAPLPEGSDVSVVRDDESVGCHCVHFFPDGTSEPTLLTIHRGTPIFTIEVKGATSEVVLTPRFTAR